MGITHATVATGTDAGTGEIHKAEWNADHTITGSFSDWDTTISKSGDEGVTNSTTFVDCADMTIAVTAGVWRVNWVIIYTSDTTGDIKFQFVFPAIDVGVWRTLQTDTTVNAAGGNQATRTVASPFGPFTAGGGTGMKVYQFESLLVPTASGDFKLQFAQNTQTAGQTATIKAGSLLQARQLA